ncbi:MAG: glycosyltransferase family 2 protein [Elusimicrobiales bacterium]|nr:glycosyltransferase family 2 protein [Elusimicrobiales bacterium]
MQKLILVTISNLAQVFLFATGLFYFFLSFRGFWRGEKPARAGERRRFALLLPAHNEEGVVGLAVQSLAGIKYPRELFDIYVVADHCTDGTVRAAADAGAKVLEHAGPGLKAGKGRAMKWATEKILAAANYDALCYFDADSLAHPGFLEAMNASLAAGAEAIQGRQLAKNTGCLLSKILASGHYITNRFFQLPKQALGLSATLHGKGMCFTAAVARKYHWDETCLTEDLEMQMRLIRHGVRISWARDAIVYDEEPETLSQYMCRTIRWTRGSLDTARRHLPGLFSRALRLGDIRAFEGALYCSQTYRFVIVTLAAGLVWYTRDSFNLLVWLYGRLPGMEHTMKALSLVPLLLYPAVALVIERARPDLAAAYFLQPLLGLLRLPIFVAGVLRGTDFWGRTEHTSRVAIADLVE